MPGLIAEVLFSCTVFIMLCYRVDFLLLQLLWQTLRPTSFANCFDSLDMVCTSLGQIEGRGDTGGS